MKIYDIDMTCNEAKKKLLHKLEIDGANKSKDELILKKKDKIPHDIKSENCQIIKR